MISTNRTRPFARFGPGVAALSLLLIASACDKQRESNAPARPAAAPTASSGTDDRSREAEEREPSDEKATSDDGGNVSTAASAGRPRTATRLSADRVVGELEKGDPLDGSEVELRRVRPLYDRPVEFADDSAAAEADMLVLRTWSGEAKGPTDAVVAVNPVSGGHTGPFEAPRSEHGGLNWTRRGDWLVTGTRADFDDVTVVSLDAGESFEPEFEVAGEVDLDALELARLQLLLTGDDDAPEVWFLALRGETYYLGSWSPDGGTVELSRFSDEYRRLRFVDEVDGRYVLEELPPPPSRRRRRGASGCRYLSWKPGAEPTCHLRGDLQPSGLSYLGRGWGVASSFRARLIGPGGDTVSLRAEGCGDPKLLGVRREEPGAVLLCSDDYSDSRQQFVYWSPDRYVTFDAPASDMITEGPARSFSRVEGSASDPVINGWWGNTDSPLVDYWFDMENVRYWTSEKLFPLHFGRRNDPSKALATSAKTGESIALYVLDFEAGTQREIATYEDCPGELREALHAGSHAVVNCVVQPNPKKFRFRVVWSELVDLATGDRGRLESYPHHLLSNGDLVVSDRAFRRPGTYRRATELEVVALAR